MLFGNVIAPQILWLPRDADKSHRPDRVSLVAVLVGMWLERILIVWNSLSHSFLPSMDRVFFPTFWDWLFLFGPVFFFGWIFLLFCRVAPVAPMYDVRELRRREALRMSADERSCSSSPNSATRMTSARQRGTCACEALIRSTR